MEPRRSGGRRQQLACGYGGYHGKRHQQRRNNLHHYHPVTVDLAAVAITINTSPAMMLINAVEKGETLVVSSEYQRCRNRADGDRHLWRQNYTTTVEANGSWTVNVPPADLAALPDGAGNDAGECQQH